MSHYWIEIGGILDTLFLFFIDMIGVFTLVVAQSSVVIIPTVSLINIFIICN